MPGRFDIDRFAGNPLPAPQGSGAYRGDLSARRTKDSWRSPDRLAVRAGGLLRVPRLRGRLRASCTCPDNRRRPWRGEAGVPFAPPANWHPGYWAEPSGKVPDAPRPGPGGPESGRKRFAPTPVTPPGSEPPRTPAR